MSLRIRKLIPVLIPLSLLVAFPASAYGDNCGSLSDCYGTVLTGVIALIAIALILAVVFIVLPEIAPFLFEEAAAAEAAAAEAAAAEAAAAEAAAAEAAGAEAAGAEAAGAEAAGGEAAEIGTSEATIAEDNAGHIFREAEGHLADTPANRKLLTDTASKAENYLGKDNWGNHWYAETRPDGSQVWAQVRNGQIRNGGLNSTARPWTPTTGMSSPSKP